MLAAQVPEQRRTDLYDRCGVTSKDAVGETLRRHPQFTTVHLRQPAHLQPPQLALFLELRLNKIDRRLVMVPALLDLAGVSRSGGCGALVIVGFSSRVTSLAEPHSAALVDFHMVIISRMMRRVKVPGKHQFTRGSMRRILA